MFRKFATALACALAVASFSVQSADAQSKKVLKKFVFQGGSITFYENKTWENHQVAYGSRDGGKWVWITDTHVCPAAWTKEKSKNHCKKTYKVK